MELIGWLNLHQNSSSSISICPDYNHPDLPWKNAYKFTALVASNANNMPGCANRSGNITAAFANFKAQSPFDQTLLVFLPSSLSEVNKATFRMFDTRGYKVLEEKIETSSSEVALEVNTIAPGVYFLQIETEGEAYLLKVVKL